MKTRLIIVLAAVAMLFSACTKEKTHKNELTWNGDTKQLTSAVNAHPRGTSYYISGWTSWKKGMITPPIPSIVKSTKTVSIRLLT